MRGLVKNQWRHTPGVRIVDCFSFISLYQFTQAVVSLFQTSNPQDNFYLGLGQTCSRISFELRTKTIPFRSVFSRTRETGRFSKCGKRGTSVPSFGVIRDGPEARVGFDRAALKRKTESGEKSSKSDRKRSQPASNLKLTSHFIGSGYSAAEERMPS